MFRKLQRAPDILPVRTIQISEFSKNSTTWETFRHLKMWSLGMWWYLVFWNVSRGRRLWNYFDKSNRKVSGHTKFQSSSCELPFKCNNAETYIQIILCRTASYVCQECEWRCSTSFHLMISLQNNTTGLYPPNLYCSKEALKHFETKCTIFTHFFNMFHSFFTMIQVWRMKQWAQFTWLMTNWDTTPAWQPSWPCWQSTGDREYIKEMSCKPYVVVVWGVDACCFDVCVCDNAAQDKDAQ